MINLKLVCPAVLVTVKLAVTIALVASPSSTAAQRNIVKYGVSGNMPVFYEQLKSTLNYPLAWGNSSITDFNEWRESARSLLLDCISPALPMADDWGFEVISEEQRDGYVAKKILFNLSSWSRIEAYLLVPEGINEIGETLVPLRAPALLLLHDHGAHFTIGKEKMVRPFDVSDELLDDSESWCTKYFEGQYVGDYFAKNGYVVFVTDALLWGGRGRKEGPLYDSQQALSANLLQMGMSWGGLIASDDVRCAEFLSNLPFVDKERVGVMGFSMGAHRAWMTAAATDCIKAAASVCWMCTTDSLMTMTNNQNKGGSAYAMLIPNLRRYMDYPHVASIACPKPMLFINGLRDKLFPVEGVKEAYSIMHEVWDSQDVSDKLQTFFLDAPHVCDKVMQREILFFFNQHFQSIP